MFTNILKAIGSFISYALSAVGAGLAIQTGVAIVTTKTVVLGGLVVSGLLAGTVVILFGAVLVLGAFLSLRSAFDFADRAVLQYQIRKSIARSGSRLTIRDGELRETTSHVHFG